LFVIFSIFTPNICLLQSLKIELFLKNRIREKISHIIPITNSGSNRSYYRIFTATNSYILTESEFVKENKSFIYFADLFNKSEVNVPIVIAVNEDFTIYLQEDIGDSSLLNVLLNEGFSDYAYKLYQNSLSQLAKLQIHTKGIIDYEKCYDFQAFNNQQVLNDLFYFKDFFVERLNIPYKKSQLIAEFFQISEKIKSFESDFFLYRDFQARNIFIKNDCPYFIDFQGGMRGFLGYDLVSLLFQAKANLSEEWQIQLKNDYANIFIKQDFITAEQFEKQYNMSLILRFLQLLGAYGLRGLVEKKVHFLESIILHFNNLELLVKQNLLISYPEIDRLIKFIISNDGKKTIEQLIKK